MTLLITGAGFAYLFSLVLMGSFYYQYFAKETDMEPTELLEKLEQHWKAADRIGSKSSKKAES